ncbi:hypothetical protein [Lentilitoribacter sp. EG35]|uniref:hypothetical protein n=1 Tax=Lentilitoribacter sp. EG35 TaxID=3234192 RepID=UPI00345F8F92
MTIEDAVEYFATSAETLLRVYKQHSPIHQKRAVSIIDQFDLDFIADNVAADKKDLAGIC